MNTALWIVQGLLSLMMLVLGVMKTFWPVENLNKFSWTTRSSKGFIRFVGIAELLIGLGLVLPEWTGIMRSLTVYAAFSLCIIMLLAIADHVRHKEVHDVWKNIVIILLAVFIVIGRCAWN